MQIQDHDRLPQLDHQHPLPTIGRSIGDDQRPQHLGKIQTALLGTIAPVLTAGSQLGRDRLLLLLGHPGPAHVSM